MMRRIINTYHINFYDSCNYRFLSSVIKPNRLDKSPITITPAAASRINDIILSKNPIPLGIRIGIRKRGCNGLSYTMDYVMDDFNTKNPVKDINGATNIYKIAYNAINNKAIPNYLSRSNNS